MTPPPLPFLDNPSSSLSLGGDGGYNHTKDERKQETGHDTHSTAVREPAIRKEILPPLLPHPPPQLISIPYCWRLCVFCVCCVGTVSPESY